MNRDYDESPVRYLDGSVQTQARLVFAVPGNGVVDLDFALQYRTRSPRQPAGYTAATSVEDQHFVGRAWEDSYSDRLLSPDAADADVVWSGFSETVAFPRGPGGSSGSHESADGRYKLTDHGAGASPRWSITSQDRAAPLRTWEFVDATPSGTGGAPPFRRGLLSAKTGAGFRLEIHRVSSTDTRITRVEDSLGRRLNFHYLTTAGTPTPPGPDGWTWQLDHISYAPAAGAPATQVASFSYDYARRLVEVGQLTGYLRFNYVLPVPAVCASCDVLLSDVIAPRYDYAAIPLPQTPPQAHEQVLEGHAFAVVDDHPLATESWSPSTHWAYRYEADRTVQVDLLLPKAGCSNAGECPAGQACVVTQQDPSGRCHVANERPHSGFRVAGVEWGGKPDENEIYIYSDDGYQTPKATIARGVITSYTFDPETGEPRCIVRNDDDYDAEEDDLLGTLDCTSNATGPVQIIRSQTVPITGGIRQSTATDSVLQPGGTTAKATELDSFGRMVAQEVAGWTQDVTGQTTQLTRRSTRQYDALGRLTRLDGPSDNTVAMDVVEYEYHNTADANRGYLRYERRFVGTTAAHDVRVTEYTDYDIFGIPRRIDHPDGRVTLLTSSDGLAWTLIEDAAVTPVVSHATFNPDGSPHHLIDADGVCVTTEISPVTNRLITKRSGTGPASGCGVLPIDLDEGDVHIVEHAPRDPSRIVRVETRRDGVVATSVAGPNYDDGRRAVGAAGRGGVGQFFTTYDGGLETSTTSPLWPADASWRTEIDADELARPTELRRFVSATAYQRTRMFYDTVWDGTPTRIERGLGTAVAQTTSFRYDDFGQLVETTSPDSGITRWQYDDAGRQTRVRHGVGTPAQRTDVTTYDSQSRVVAVDRDLEHPVDCASAPDGTPIADDLFVYDQCDAEASQEYCDHSTGRLTAAVRLVACNGGEATKLLRWYDYDRHGRLVKSTSMRREGGRLDKDGGDISYEWTPAGRLARIFSDVGAHGSAFSYSPAGTVAAMGVVQDMYGTADALLTGVSYTPTGGLSGYRTRGDLELTRTYSLDGSLEVHTWDDGIETWPESYLFYDAGGLLVAVDDANHPSDSRAYSYDHLQRLTCERHGDIGSLQPCEPTNSQVHMLLGYHDGSSPLAPPDHRASAVLRTSDAEPEELHVASYQSGTNRLGSVARGSDSVVYEHDALGRRTADYLASDPTGSRRTYTYLPDGQLWQVIQPSRTLTLSYGVGGLLTAAHDSKGEQDEVYYYDDFGRVIAGRSGPGDVHRDTTDWSFHYLGSQPVAATTKDGSTVVFVFDHRGLIIGATEKHQGLQFRADYNAFGARIEADEGPLAFVPFVLPGQLRLPGSAASGREPLHANGARVYDPHVGAYLSPDPADLIGRNVPEGYAYARNNPVAFSDPSGESSYYYWDDDTHSVYGPDKTFHFDSSCTSDQKAALIAATRQAIRAIAQCTDTQCGPVKGSAFMAKWLFSLSTGESACAPMNGHFRFGSVQMTTTNGVGDGTAAARTEFLVPGPGLPEVRGRVWERQVIYAPVAFDLDAKYRGRRFPKCLAGTVAHEAAHAVMDSISETRMLDQFEAGYTVTLDRAYEFWHLVPFAGHPMRKSYLVTHPYWDRLQRQRTYDTPAEREASYINTMIQNCDVCGP